MYVYVYISILFISIINIIFLSCLVKIFKINVYLYHFYINNQNSEFIYLNVIRILTKRLSIIKYNYLYYDIYIYIIYIIKLILINEIFFYINVLHAI